MNWGLAEWTVLAVLRESPSHGFAVAALTAPGGELGRVWQIPRPVVYRALGRLHDAGLITPGAVESGAGPQRTVYAVTEDGRDAVDGWLREPVRHVREVRSQLLMKLALLDRAGRDPAALLDAQREVLERTVEALSGEPPAPGFDAVLVAWRRSTAAAALDFVRTARADAR